MHQSQYGFGLNIATLPTTRPTATLPIAMLTCILPVALGISAPAWSDDTETPSPAGKVIMARGEVVAVRQPDSTVPLKRRSPIYQQDTLQTGPAGKAQVRFTDGGLVALKPSSQLTVAHYESAEQGPDVVMDLIEGGFRTLTGTLGKQGPDAYQVNTPVGTIGIRGTLYSALMHKGELLLGTWQGSILVNTSHGDYLLGAGADFNFAAISSSGFTGLLQPPMQLQPAGVSSAPSDDESEETAASEESSDEHTVVLTPLEREADADTLAKFEQDDQLGEDDPVTPATEPVSPDSRLSLTEYNLFMASNRLGGIVTGSSLRVGSVIDQDEQEPIFVTLAGEENLDVIRFQGESEQREQPSEQLDVEWGIWTGSDQAPIEIYPERNSDIHSDLTEQSIWLMGTPTRSIDLDGLTGTINFAGTEAIGFNSAGASLSSASGSFDLNLSNGDVSNGTFNASFGNPESDQAMDQWALGFDGSIRAGDLNTAVVDIDIQSGSHNEDAINLDESAFEGILVGQQAEGFVGGFYLIDNDGNNATGAILMEQNAR